MTVICEACTQGNLDDVKESAFQCLERIAELYYRKLPKYIQTILDITIQAINTQEDAVARQAINVWVQVCDVEYDFESDADAPGHHEFIKGASQYLIPVLLQTMSKQEDDQDSEAFNKSTEAAWCLNSIATVIEKDIIPYVVPWVHQNISSADWRCKEAAVMAYGCILDGLNNKESSLGQHAPAVMDLCLGYIKDEAVTLVKDSSAWTINKVCETDHAFETILGPQFADRIQRMLEVMHTAEPSTSVHLATALRHTAENILRICENEAENMPPDFPLAHVFQVIVECLYATADRKDADENGLRHECYEAMNSVLDSINANKVADQWKPTCIQIVQQYIIPNLLPRFGERLNAELGKNVLNSDDVNARTEWVAYFCGAIQMSICALSDKSMLIVQDANQQTVADKFMTLFLQVFQFQNTTVAAEAILAVNQILNQLGEDFERYMAAFVPVLVGCLCVVQDVQLCRNAIATVSDLACLLKEKVLPYGDAIVQAMLGIFANPAVDADIQQIHDYIKPVACSAIGDLARELGKGMDKYLAAFLETLHTVSTNTARLRQELSAVAEPDEDKMEYLNAMIAGVLDGYTGILYGLADAEKNDAPGAVDAFCQPKALDQGAFLMIQEVALAGNGNYDLLGDEALSKAVGLVGDMAMNFKGRQHAAQIKAMLSVEHVKALLQKGKDSTDEDLKGLAQWTEIQLQGMA
jgi:importin subunit beta-1